MVNAMVLEYFIETLIEVIIVLHKKLQFSPQLSYMADCDGLNITFIYTHHFFFITHSLSHGQLFYFVLLEFFAPNKSKLLLPPKKKKKKKNSKLLFFFFFEN